MPSPHITVALVGNPNTGKSTLFNALSGLRQHVGNYPGVTVDMMKGRFTHQGVAFELIDLPGTYSLAPRSPDEMVAVDLLLGRRPEEPRPDVVLSIVDASNLDRHLYLTTQVMELGVPVVLAVNMVDVAEAQGVKFDCESLARETGLRVVPIQANKGVGLDRLKDCLLDATKHTQVQRGPQMPDPVVQEIQKLESELLETVPTFLVRRLLFDVGGHTENWLVNQHGPLLSRHVADARERLAQVGCSIPGVEAKTRYGWIRGVTAKSVTKPQHRPVTLTDRIDRVLTHKVWGTIVFLTVMFLMFQSIFIGAEFLMDPIERLFSNFADLVKESLPPGPVRSLLADGVISGVGGVLVFLPQIVILFGFIAVLEDCGYMARAAFLMDRIMSRCGLSGKSFIPLLSSVACAVPGIMATRVIENRRDRIATILVAPLMSCSARLPVYGLLIGAFLTEGFAWWVPGVTLFGLYMLGFILAPLAAVLLKRTVLRGVTPLFVMELPAFRRPSLLAVFRRMVDAGWAFIRRAGSLILASMVLVWALLYFPNGSPDGRSYENRIAELESQTEGDIARTREEVNQLRGEWQRQSLLGRTGRALEPVFEPLGWDWRIGMAALASFPAREVVVGTLGILYDQGNIEGEEGEASLREAIRSDWKSDPVRSRYPVPAALSLLVFFALCCQCVSTLAVIRRETRSGKWALFTFVYMTLLAYFGAMITFQVGRVITNLVT